MATSTAPMGPRERGAHRAGLCLGLGDSPAPAGRTAVARPLHPLPLCGVPRPPGQKDTGRDGGGGGRFESVSNDGAPAPDVNEAGQGGGGGQGGGQSGRCPGQRSGDPGHMREHRWMGGTRAAGAQGVCHGGCAWLRQTCH